MKEESKKQKLKTQERGITLIALVITIVILIILATVTLNVVLGEGGLIQRAQEGKVLSDQAQKDEQDELKRAEEYINGVVVGINSSEEKSEVEEARKSGTVFEDTTTITDDLDNAVTVPGGFNIAEDSGTKVEEGIVIEDSNNNQFVWIPVGEYNVTDKFDLDGMKDGKITNELTRREWADENVVEDPIPVSGDNVIDEEFYGEGAVQTKEGESISTVAKDQIDAFKTSAITNKGFYIGRYEQGEGNVCKAGVNPYANLTRDKAKQQAEAMYSENEFVTSQLISSYAWDTALNFMCQTNEEGYLLATTQDEAYGNMGTFDLTQTGQYKVNGVESDKYSNIYDLLGNRNEWTTEYSTHIVSNDRNNYPCVYRGCSYVGYEYAATRGSYRIFDHHIAVSFRLQLYVNPES